MLAIAGFDQIICRPGKYQIAELTLGKFISPLFELTFRKFHDVTLVHQRYRLSVELNGIGNGTMNQPHAAAVTHCFNAKTNLHIVVHVSSSNHLPEFF